MAKKLLSFLYLEIVYSARYCRLGLDLSYQNPELIEADEAGACHRNTSYSKN